MSLASASRAYSASHMPAVHVTDVPTAVQLMQCAPQPDNVSQSHALARAVSPHNLTLSVCAYNCTQQSITRPRPGGVMVRALELRLNGRGFDLRPFRFQVTTLRKLFTHVHLSASSNI